MPESFSSSHVSLSISWIPFHDDIDSFGCPASAVDLQTGHVFFTTNHFLTHSTWYSCPQSTTPISSPLS